MALVPDDAHDANVDAGGREGDRVAETRRIAEIIIFSQNRGNDLEPVTVNFKLYLAAST